jgi:hypothetical protein
VSARRGVAQAKHLAKRVASDMGWQGLAACAGHDPELFFDPERYAAALAVCRHCPVQGPCRELGRTQRYGVWAGRIHGLGHKRVCPVCREPVGRTRFDRIAGHRDSAGNRCPAGGLTYQMAEEA